MVGECVSMVWVSQWVRAHDSPSWPHMKITWGELKNANAQDQAQTK